MSRYRGIRLTFEKKPAILLPTAELTDVAQVVLPFAYATEAPVTRTVSLYDTVRQGTPLSEVAGEPFSAVRSSVTGAVSGEKQVLHPLYGDLQCAVIDCIPESVQPSVAPDETVITAESIIEAAQNAGVIDELDGVPLMLKLRDWQENGCDFVVGDAMEVQPYTCAAWAALRSYAEEAADGLSLIAGCARASGWHIAACLSLSRRRSLAMRVGKDHVFQGDARYPVREPVRRRKKNGGVFLPRNARVCRVGIQACIALARAVRLHAPHTHTIVTVAGDAVKNPQNLLVPFGTPVQELLRRVGLCADPATLILGDIMTGTAATTQDVPVLPGMTCVLAFTAARSKTPVSRACIGCGRCARVCHAGLLPFEIYRRFENLHHEHLTTLSADACDGCGACSYVCPCSLDLAATVQDVKQNGHTILLDLKEESDA